MDNLNLTDAVNSNSGLTGSSVVTLVVAAGIFSAVNFVVTKAFNSICGRIERRNASQGSAG